MNLSHGGHLTHGSKVNSSGKLYNFIPYGVDEKTGRIEYVVSDKPDSFMKQALILLGEEASGDITKIDIEKEK